MDSWQTLGLNWALNGLDLDMRRWRQILLYLWVAPASLVGLLLAVPWLLQGAKAARSGGALEIYSPRPLRGRFGAITLGHVILASDARQMALLRAHEGVHVRQYERWGVLFFPLYLLSGCWQLMRGRRFYRDNYFEREAYGDLKVKNIDHERHARNAKKHE